MVESEASRLQGVSTEQITVTVNGSEVTETVDARLKLSDFLHDVADDRSVRVGCEHGVCGACAILVDDQLVKSCLMYAVQVDGSEIRTATGLTRADGSLTPIQQTFHEEHALQCGFCTSGFLMAATSLLEENPAPTREEVRTALSGNICQCTGYQNIYSAVERASDRTGEE